MNLIILASGLSKRFKKEGYSISKFLLPFYKRRVIDYLINIKNIEEIIIIYNESDFKDKNLKLEYQALCCEKDIQIKIIKPHNLGPVYSLFQIISDIKQEKSYAISYCDYVSSAFWESNLKINSEIDALVLTYKGFHPHHLFEKSIYGYLKLNNKGFAIDYKEKESFTSSKTEENCSAGLYIFNKGKNLVNSIKEVIKEPDNYQINGEYYVSMIVKNYIKKSLKVKCLETKYFAQLGTPNDYEDHIHWLKNAINLKKIKSANHLKDNSINAICCILISGLGTRFSREGYKENKSFLEINGWPILKYIIKAMPKFKHYFFAIPAINGDLASKINNLFEEENINYTLININTPNEGQADSCLQALEKIFESFIDIDYPIYIAPCDSIIKINTSEIFSGTDSHGLVVSTSNPFLRLNPKSYSYTSENDKKNLEIVVKRLPPKDLIVETNTLTGAFYSGSFKSLYKDLKDLYGKIEFINEERYLDSFFKYLLSKDKNKISVSKALDYNSIGTPLEYRTAIYWNEFLNSLKNS